MADSVVKLCETLCFCSLFCFAQQ